MMWSLVALGRVVFAGQADYTTNAVCLIHKCVNPAFPAFRLAGTHVMDQLEAREMACVADWQTSKAHSRFCSKAILHEFALPNDDGAAPSLIAEADHNAILAFVSHLDGLGFDHWDHQTPWDDDPCIKSIWELVCYTYFPKCNGADSAKYLRPCKSACENYLNQCQIECCDEGLTCVFSHDEVYDEGTVVSTKGYVNHVGPSELCTGTEQISGAASNGPSWFLMGLLLLVSLLFQGCDRWGGYIIPQGTALDVGVATHKRAFWRQQADYSLDRQVIKSPEDGSVVLNSCMTPGISSTKVCSGRGHCHPWDPDDLANPMWICMCDDAWAGMECSVQRYSQSTAWALSTFFGYLGVDQLYLGFPVIGASKFVTLGGAGLWWIYDVVYIGAGPIYAKTFRVAPDLPHWAYTIFTVFVFTMLGFLFSIRSLSSTIRLRRKLADQVKNV